MLRRKIYATVVILLLLLGISVISYGKTTGVITGETVKLRKEASLEAGLVALLSVDNKVEVLGEEGDWYQVKYQDKTGYVYKDYIKVNGELTDTNTNNVIDNTTNNTTDVNETENVVNETNTSVENTVNTNTIPQESQEKQKEEFTIPSEQILAQDANITILPLIQASSIGDVKAQTKVTAMEYKNGWVYIVSEKVAGWIREEKLQVKTETPVEENNTEQPEEQAPEEEKPQETKVGYVNVDSVNVRKQASATSEVISGATKNTKVTISAEENGWYKVEIDGKEGYISKKYISDRKVEETTNRSSTTERTKKEEPEVAQVTNTSVTENKDTSSTITQAKGSEVVSYAKTFLGYPYVLGATGPKAFDCSGFTYYVYKHFGYTLNRTATAQKSNGVAVAKSELQLGDLVLFTGHVGIYVGGNSFIHAANPKKGVVITSLSDSYYVKNYITARRII